MTRFVKAIDAGIDPLYIAANKIVSLRLRTDETEPFWLATMTSNHTHRLSEEIARILLLNAIRAELPYDDTA